MTASYDGFLESRSEIASLVPMAPTFSKRTLLAINGLGVLDKLTRLSVAVEQGMQDQRDGCGPSDDELNILRRTYIRIASEVYREKASIR